MLISTTSFYILIMNFSYYYLYYYPHDIVSIRLIRSSENVMIIFM